MTRGIFSKMCAQSVQKLWRSKGYTNSHINILLLQRRKINREVKGGEFYDKVGAEVGTENPINGALATFIDRLS